MRTHEFNAEQARSANFLSNPDCGVNFCVEIPNGDSFVSFRTKNGERLCVKFLANSAVEPPYKVVIEQYESMLCTITEGDDTRLQSIDGYQIEVYVNDEE